ncbi:hypothetical protein LPB86_17540 [Pedobacter sp. MC2016-14]|uniref:hypothetical protein n=1 Tax=Pedobacter sp. MC2016-14 TaxID=2897327 RepID=UPI001E3CCCD5|nr:hypothetical protein [Pedobacter sp. MC2016-14]MCD0490048.1 hypothetical protein [Pedobacter sp. MC2016-14]
MIKYKYKNLDIELSHSPEIYDSSAERVTYLETLYSESDPRYGGSRYEVKVSQNGKELRSCILISSYGTDLHPFLSLLDDHLLLVCNGGTVFCLNLPDLQLNWQANVDYIYCFKIFKFKDDYLVNGELAISRINKAGEIKWSFSGADIFFVMDGTDAVVVNHDHILLTDFEKNTYKIDFDGNLIWDSINRACK